MIKTSCRLAICLEKCFPGFTQVTLRDPPTRGFGLGAVVDVVHIQGHRGGIVEGAQHTTDVLVRAVLAPAFGQWPRRFALEVDQVGVALDHQHLPQMQVAVHADPQAASGLFGQLLHVGKDGFLVVEQPSNKFLIRRIEFAELPKTISGKIRRVELRRGEEQRAAALELAAAQDEADR